MLYLGTIIAGIYAEAFVRGALLVSGDAHATAANIMAQAPMYRSALFADLVMLSCYIAVTTIFCELFREAGPRLSLLAAGFSMTGIAVLAASSLLLMLPLLLLRDVPYLAVFDPGQRATLALLALKMHGEGYGIALVFFGIYCVLLGVLIWRGGLLPQAIGALMLLAGVCYLIDSIAGIAAPAVARLLPAQILLPTLIGEGALALWLIFFGIRPVKLLARQVSH